MFQWKKVVLCLVMVTSFVSAQDQKDESSQLKWVVGFNAGQSNATSGAGSTTALGVFGGFETRNFGVELGYDDLGGLSDTSNNSTLKVDFSAIRAVAVGRLNFDRWVLAGKVGISRGKADFTITNANYPDGGLVIEGSASQTKALAEVGLYYTLGKSTALSLEVTKYSKFDFDFGADYSPLIYRAGMRVRLN